MKRAISLLLSLILLLALLPACSQPAAEPDEPEPTPEETRTVRELADAVFPASGGDEALKTEYLNADEDAERLAVYIEAVCALTRDQWEDAAVIRATGASAFEIIVLRLGDKDAAAQLETVLTDYLTARQGAFTGYAPAEAEMVANGRVRREGRTLGLFICPDSERAEAAFTAAYNGKALPPLPEPEPEPEPEPALPSFPINELLLRLLVEAACPGWFSLRGDHCMLMSQLSNFKPMVESRYGISPEQYEKFAPAWWTLSDDIDGFLDSSESIYELLVFRAESEAVAEELVSALTSYLEEKEARLREEGLTDAAELVHSGQTAHEGPYALLAVSDYAQETVQCFSQAVYSEDTSGYYQRAWEEYRAASSDPAPADSGRVPFTQPNLEDMSLYDTSAIRSAWEAGDPAGLSDYDKEIYGAAKAVLDEISTGGMSGYEKEKAVYSWIVNSVDYDWTHQDPLQETPRESYTPYGGLVNRSAVCLGYAASFQLLMDMSGVECITIVGASSNSMEDHAWNMVRLDGEWYCVDVTWDANGREQRGPDHVWQYFNVTSDEMARDHQWDYDNTPEATAEDHG